ncbi:MAG: hypothetical protein K0U80_12715, partial [Actinomycetia bacterium]|nr:hypothetical protein [Actinomycetes bacterium]
GLIKSEAPGCNQGLHHGGEYGNHRSCARDDSIAGAQQQLSACSFSRCAMSQTEDFAAELELEIREDRAEPDGPAQIEAWLPGWSWPVVSAVQRGDGWLVLVGAEVSVTAGVRKADRSGLDAINADEARIWVELLAALYVKAAAT